jgi:hypothetical protein
MEVCPRCGSKGYIEYRRRGDRVYVYMHHRMRVDGKNRVKTCYLGARSYEYVERLNPIGLRDATDRDRFMKYALSIIECLTADQLATLKRLIEEKLRSDIEGG